MLRRLERDLQYAIVERRLRRVAVHAIRQRDGTEEVAIAALAPSALLVVLLPLPLAFEDEHVVADLAMHVVLRQAGEIGAHDQLPVALLQLDLRRPKAA